MVFKSIVLCFVIATVGGTVHLHNDSKGIDAVMQRKVDKLPMPILPEDWHPRSSSRSKRGIIREERNRREIIVDEAIVDEPGVASNPQISTQNPLAPGSSRLCTQGFYCGHHLRELGYTNVVDNTLYECDSDNDALWWQQCADGCVGSAGRGTCNCRAGVAYCGYELRKYNFFLPQQSDHNLYRCHSKNEVRRVESCNHRCSANNVGDSECLYGNELTGCVPGAMYCGLELTAKRFTSRWGPHLLYQCMNDGQSAQYLEWCYSGCIANSTSYCTIGRMAGKPMH